MFETRKVEPVGERTFRALVKPRSGPCTFQDVTEPTYPDEPRGEKLRQARIAISKGVDTVARKLGIGPADLSAVEFGRAVFASPADYDRALEAIRSLAAPAPTPGPMSGDGAK